MCFVYFSHVLGSPLMVYSRNSIPCVNYVNWGLDSGEVSMVDWPFVLSNSSRCSCTNVIHIILSNSSVTELCIFTILCICACVYVCVHVSVNQ